MQHERVIRNVSYDYRELLILRGTWTLATEGAVTVMLPVAKIFKVALGCWSM